MKFPVMISWGKYSEENSALGKSRGLLGFYYVFERLACEFSLHFRNGRVFRSECTLSWILEASFIRLVWWCWAFSLWIHPYSHARGMSTLQHWMEMAHAHLDVWEGNAFAVIKYNPVCVIAVLIWFHGCYMWTCAWFLQTGQLHFPMGWYFLLILMWLISRIRVLVIY